jgi:hypothetical protein
VKQLAVLLILAGVLGAACAGEDAATPQSSLAPASCPAKWRAGWQQLANRVDEEVYCPSWMPNPLTGEIGGEWDNGVSVKRDRSYLVSFLWHEAPSGDVHVNFRGYPGQTAIPTCRTTETVAGKTRRKQIPCFSDSQGRRRVGSLTVTVFTVNQNVDQWHVLYAWRKDGTLYTASQHVTEPLTYRQVVRSLDRVVRGLTVVAPAA